MTNKYQRIINGAPADVYDVLDAFGSGTPRNDLSGQTFGKLKPIQYNNGRWACMCDCGNVAFVKTGNLTSGNSSSCGCAKAAARKRKDMKPGDSFGRWTLMSYLGGSRWSCVCQCGTEGTASTSNLRDGKTKSCGCLNDEAITTHDMSHHPLYKTWRGMVARCHVESDKSYKWYGARGISVCDEWRKNISDFIDYMGERPVGMTLDRIDNDGNYEPGNVRWADIFTQNNNRSNSKGRRT